MRIAPDSTQGYAEFQRPACSAALGKRNQLSVHQSRIGYAIGIGYPGPSWNERTASLQPGNTTVLEPNMTFHMILGMWMADWGFEISETFRVTEGAPEVLSQAPREVFVKAP